MTEWNGDREKCQIGSNSIHRIVDIENLPFAADLLYPDANSLEIQELVGKFGYKHFDPNSLDLLLSFHAFLVRTPRYNVLVKLGICEKAHS
ncbi:MAG: hypothetical protein ACKVHB_07005 [Pseudomonadales bacterium]